MQESYEGKCKYIGTAFLLIRFEMFSPFRVTYLKTLQSPEHKISRKKLWFIEAKKLPLNCRQCRYVLPRKVAIVISNVLKKKWRREYRRGKVEEHARNIRLFALITLQNQEEQISSEKKLLSVHTFQFMSRGIQCMRTIRNPYENAERNYNPSRVHTEYKFYFYIPRFEQFLKKSLVNRSSFGRGSCARVCSGFM